MVKDLIHRSLSEFCSDCITDTAICLAKECEGAYASRDETFWNKQSKDSNRS